MTRYFIGRCRIPDLLEQRGWTQRYLAELSGVSEKTISHYTTENDPRKRMTLEVALSLAEALDVHPRELFELIRFKRSVR